MRVLHLQTITHELHGRDQERVQPASDRAANERCRRGRQMRLQLRTAPGRGREDNRLVHGLAEERRQKALVETPDGLVAHGLRGAVEEAAEPRGRYLQPRADRVEGMTHHHAGHACSGACSHRLGPGRQPLLLVCDTGTLHHRI